MNADPAVLIAVVAVVALIVARDYLDLWRGRRR